MKMRTASLFICAMVFIWTVSQAGAFPVGIYFQGQSRMAVMRINASSNQSETIQAGAQKFVRAMTDNAVGFLTNQDLSQDQRKKEFRKLLNSNFDMNTIGRFALGRYWRGTTKAQQKEYHKLFRAMIVETYSKRFSDYQGQDIEAANVRPEGKKDVLVTSYILGNPKVQVDWRVRYSDGRYKIIDIMVEGVSMALTQRSEFASVIQRGGGTVDVLLAHLRER